jgi:hypothetical protein
MVDFSLLIFQMRYTVERRLRRDTDPEAVIQLALGDLTAAGVAHVFFGMCKLLGNLEDKKDEDVYNHLFDAVVNKAIPKRNDVAHGDWWVGWVGPDFTEVLTPGYTRTVAKAGKGQALIEVSPKDLDAESDHLWHLRNIVTEFGLICFGQHDFQLSGRAPSLRITDILVLQGPKGKRSVARRGLLAARGAFG